MKYGTFGLLTILISSALGAMETGPHLSLLSNDGCRFWINRATVCELAPLQNIINNLPENKFLTTQLNESTTRLLKDLIDTWHEYREKTSGTILLELKRVLAKHCEIHQTLISDITTLIAEAHRLGLAPITRTVAWHLYATKSEYTKKEFADLGITNLADATLYAITTADNKVFILPEDITSASPYLQTWCNSSYKESRNRMLELPADYSSETIALMLDLIKLIHEHKIVKNKPFAHIRPLIEVHLQKQKEISTHAILVADQWLMPELAHTLTQFILADTGLESFKIIKELPATCLTYVPPFMHDNKAWLQGRAVPYLQHVADAAHQNLIEDEEKIAATSIAMIAKDFDNYVTKIGSSMQELFKKPNMQKIAQLLKKELIKTNAVHDSCIAKNLDSYAIKSLVKLANNRLLVTTDAQTSVFILDTATGNTHCAIGGFFENIYAANRWDDNHIITAAYKKMDHLGRFLAVNNIYGSTIDKWVAYITLKLWNISTNTPQCASETKMHITASQIPKIKHLEKLDDTKAIVQLDHDKLYLWTVGTENTQEIDLVAILRSRKAKKCLVIDPRQIAILYKEIWDPANHMFNEKLCILDPLSKKITPLPEHTGNNGMKSLATLLRFDDDHLVTCAHENWYSSQRGQCHDPVTKIIHITTGKEKILSMQEGNSRLGIKKEPFSTLKINDQQFLTTGVNTQVFDALTDTAQGYINKQPGWNPALCAALLGNGRVALGTRNGTVNIVTANILLSLPEIIALRKQQLEGNN